MLQTKRPHIPHTSSYKKVFYEELLLLFRKDGGIEFLHRVLR